MTEAPVDPKDQLFLLELLCGEDSEDLIYLLREELRFLRAYRKQNKAVQKAFQIHRKLRTPEYSLSPQEKEDWKDPIFRATGIRG